MLHAVVTEPHDAGHSQEADGQTQEDPSLHANLLVPLRDTSQVQGVGWEGGAFIDLVPSWPPTPPMSSNVAGILMARQIRHVVHELYT